MSEGEPTHEQLKADEVIAHLSQLIDDWDFYGHTQLENGHFTVHIAHWAAEVFGQHNDKGRFFVDPKHEYGQGFKAEEMPPGLRQLTVFDYYGTPHESDHNSVGIVTDYEAIETDPYIPKWNELSQIPVFVDRLEAARNDPEVMAMLMPGKFEITPRVDLIYRPGVEQQWGLQFVMRPNGVEALPFGPLGTTKVPFEFAREAIENQAELMKSMAELLIVALKNADQGMVRFAHPSMIDVLRERLTGAASIPLEGLKLESNPRNGTKNLLIHELLKSREQEA